MGLCLVAVGTPGSAEIPRIEEGIEVPRVLIDARVVDRFGDNIVGLGVGDFDVRVDGEPVRLESVDWYPARPETREEAEPAADPKSVAMAPPDAPSPGRLVVLLFQRHLHPSRIIGLMRMVPQAERLVDELGPQDRMAILTYEHQLRLYSDFTNDREKLHRVLQEAIITYEPPPDRHVSSEALSLASRLSPHAAKDAAHIEDALLLIGEALRDLPGSKSLVFFGWGLGRLVWPVVEMRPAYRPALQTLLDAKVTVFSLDLTQADYHSLEGPLISVARTTGGFYAKTHLFPAETVRRVARALDGYYVLSVAKPAGEPGAHRVDVRLARREGTVYARGFYED